MAEAGTWDEAMLMGVGEEGKGAEAVKSDPMLWGVPGYLTKEEADAFVSFYGSLKPAVLSAIVRLVIFANYDLSFRCLFSSSNSRLWSMERMKKPKRPSIPLEKSRVKYGALPAGFGLVNMCWRIP